MPIEATELDARLKLHKEELADEMEERIKKVLDERPLGRIKTSAEEVGIRMTNGFWFECFFLFVVMGIPLFVWGNLAGKGLAWDPMWWVGKSEVSQSTTGGKVHSLYPIEEKTI